MSIIKVLLDGRIVLFTRDSPKNNILHWRIKIPGQPGCYDTRSSRTDNLRRAIELAKDRLHEMEFKEKNGLSVKPSRFDAVARAYIEFLDSKPHNPRTPNKNFNCKAKLVERYLLYFFGSDDFQKITNQRVEEYHQWRRDLLSGESCDIHIKRIKSGKKNYDRNSECYSESILNGMARWAVRTGIITRQDVRFVLRPRPIRKRRGVYTEEQLLDILNKLEDFEREAIREDWKRSRCCLKNLVKIMANCGLRPHEALSMTWKDLKVEVVDGRRVPILKVDGKTGPRVVVGKQQAIEAFDDLMRLSSGIDENELIFISASNVDGYARNFKKITSKAGFWRDDNGEKLSLYSFRHFYITKRLMENTDIHLISRNCGTSIDQIERHYSHVEPVKRIHELM